MRALGFALPGTPLPRLHRRLHPPRFYCAASSPHRIVFLGTPPVAATTLSTLISRAPSVNAEIVAVVTRAPAAVGRKRIITRTAVHETALAHGIPTVLTPSTARDAGFLEKIERLAPDLCVTAAYGHFLPQRFLDAPRLGTLNVHPSLLPAFRGAAPVPRALEEGVEATGVSVAFTVLKMDAGPVVAQTTRVLEGDERAPDLLESLFEQGTDDLLRVLPSVWDGSVDCWPQDEANASHAPKLDKQEARLTFTETARIVHNKVRAFAGWPGTWADFEVGEYMKGEAVRLKVVRTRVLRERGGMCLGVHDVSFDAEKDCLAVTCDDGSVIGVSVVQPPGKREMSARAFWNGVRGKRFGRKRVPH